MFRDVYGEIEKVIKRDNCSGCGACANAVDGVTMRLDSHGFARPFFSLDQMRANYKGPQSANNFRDYCPGVQVERPSNGNTESDAVLGSFISLWKAHAIDPIRRQNGSSGGVLHTLSQWLLEEQGSAGAIVGVQALKGLPDRSTTVAMRLGENGQAYAGSRYAPTSVASHPDSIKSDSIVTGKPCEVSALRRQTADSSAPFLLSFFCAGTPSQNATDLLLKQLGRNAQEVVSLRYRGDGWPGNFRAELSDGTELTTTYEHSWGSVLGRELQWRCKLCPDGLGESADIVAGDLWNVDSRGYPEFTESDGVSALIARTARGHDAIRRAVNAGIIAAQPTTAADILNAQPSQVERKKTLVGRLAGTRLAGTVPPRYKGFHLFSLMQYSIFRNIRVAYGTWRRRRSALRQKHES